MYSDFIDFLKQNDLFIEKEIADFHNTPWDDRTYKLVDVVEIKENEYNSGSTPKTVNGFFFPQAVNINLLFIELICFYASGKDQITFCNDVMNEINEKIEGTKTLITYLFGKKNYTYTDFTQYVSSKGNKINTIVLTEMNPRDYTILRIGNLEKLKIKSQDPIIGEVLLYNCEMFQSKF